ncbi:MAG TPA: PHP domain-containing protein [Candidatus Fournierella merdavium]|nr:PHP domain-containing protein [Candidatus Fournierella merdavium]
MRYDLHLHTCLSPCADRDMTPANVAGLAKLAGAGLIAVTDHNSALNLPAAARACREYGLRLLPGLEVTCAEEIHLLCYFKTVEAALEYGRQLWQALPPLPCDPAIWGEQWVMDEEDRVLARINKLLPAACAWPLEEAAARCRSLGGEPVPAHADAGSYSAFSVLGLLPAEAGFRAVELQRPERAAEYERRGLLPPGLEVLASSDAHFLSAVGGRMEELPPESVLCRLL